MVLRASGLLCLLEAAVALAMPVQAEIGVQILDYGIGGLMRSGAWNPVTVEVSNSGPDFQGSLEIGAAELGPMVNEVLHPVFERPIELPRGTSKRLTLYLFKGPGNQQVARVQMLDAGGRPLWTDRTRPITMIGPEGRIVAVVGNWAAVQPFLLLPPEPGTADPAGPHGVEAERAAEAARGTPPLPSPVQPLAKAKPRARVEISARVLDEDILPDHSAGYESASAIFLFQASPARWRPAQRRAIEEWVAAGGTLIAAYGGRQEDYSETFLKGLVPEPSSWDEIEVSPDRFRCLSSARPKLPVRILPVRLDGGRALALSDGHPLVVERQHGAGRVLYLAFDIRQQALLDWPGRAALLHSVIENPLARTPGELKNFTLSSLNQLDQLRQPAFWHIGLFLFASILCLGPLNYFILRRLGRKEWAFATVPALSVLFAFGGYYWTLGIKGGTVVIKRISLLSLDTESPKARRTDWAGLFTPAHGVYTLMPSSPSVRWRRPDLPEYFGELPQAMPFQAFSLDALPNHDSPAFLPAPLEVGMWSYHLFSTEDVLEVGRLEADCQVRNRKIECRIRNGTRLSLQVQNLWLGRFLAPWGVTQGQATFQPGEVKSFAWDSIAENVEMGGYGNFSPPKSVEGTSRVGRELFLWGRCEGLSPPAWTLVSGKAETRSDTTFYAFLPLRLDPGSTYHPPGTICGRVADYTATQVYFATQNSYTPYTPYPNDGGSWSYVSLSPNTYIVFAYDIPLDVLEWREVGIQVVPHMQQGSGAVTLEAWQTDPGEWRKVESGSAFPGRRCLNLETGEFLLRVTPRAGGNCILLDVSVGMEKM
ncbi:MAG: hypothetical protein HYU36_15790 [Planctomycetes bacterium]|nr:hypothetical protein [Planctomycetota bacterium]